MRRTVAVDVDGVLADYSKGWQGIEHIGDPIPGAKEFLEELAKDHDVLIYTTRCSSELARGEAANLLRSRVFDWLAKHGFDEGTHWHDIWVGQGKPIYAAMVDDRAVTCDPQGLHIGDPPPFPEDFNRRQYHAALNRVRHLCGTIPAGERVRG